MVSQLMKIPREIARGRIAFFGGLRETTLDQPLQGNRQVRAELAEGLWLVPQNRNQGLRRGPAPKCPTATGHLVDQEPERELIRSSIHRKAARLFRRHVFDGADKGSRLGFGLRARARVRLEGGFWRALGQ